MGKRSRKWRRMFPGAQKGGATKAAPSLASTSALADLCHDGPAFVFKLGKARVYAGAQSDFQWSDREFALYVVCAGESLAPEAPLLASPEARALMPAELLVPRAPWVAIPWVDGSIPSWDVKQWGALATALARVDGNVGVYCLGGHGRTGTALAILASLGGAVPHGADPVKWVRDHYCDHAVERDLQARYVERITGAKVWSEGSEADLWHGYANGGSYVGGGYSSSPSVAPRAPVVMGPKPVPSPAPSPPPAPLAAQAAGRVGVPIVNAAGDVIGYDYTVDANENPFVEEGDVSQPWKKWGTK